MAMWGSITARGTVTVPGGQATYQEGTLKLYVDDGKR